MQSIAKMSVSEKMLVFSISMLVVVLPTVVTQQPPSIAPSSAPNCMNIIASNMGDCFDYVSRNSSFESPSESCCGGLATVVKNEFHCLCQFLQDSDYRLSINTSRVLHLPSICDVNATLSQCQNGNRVFSLA